MEKEFDLEKELHNHEKIEIFKGKLSVQNTYYKTAALFIKEYYSEDDKKKYNLLDK